MQSPLRMLGVVVALLVSACAAQAQTQAGSSPQRVTIDDAAWLAGRLVGTGFGGQMEEAWAPPVGGQMVGHFRLVRDGAPVFYEIMLIDVVEGGVRMRVKHFNPDFVGWEEKDRWGTFEPVSASENELVFSSLSIQREGPDDMVMRLRIRYADGPREEVLRFRRAPT